MKAFTVLLALGLLVALGGQVQAGDKRVLCKDSLRSQGEMNIPENRVVKLEISGACANSDEYAAGKNCSGEYLVFWSTPCGDSDEKAGKIEYLKTATLYMPICNRGGIIKFWCTAGCIRVDYNLSLGY